MSQFAPKIQPNWNVRCKFSVLKVALYIKNILIIWFFFLLCWLFLICLRLCQVSVQLSIVLSQYLDGLPRSIDLSNQLLYPSQQVSLSLLTIQVESFYWGLAKGAAGTIVKPVAAIGTAFGEAATKTSELVCLFVNVVSFEDAGHGCWKWMKMESLYLFLSIIIQLEFRCQKVAFFAEHPGRSELQEGTRVSVRGVTSSQ